MGVAFQGGGEDQNPSQSHVAHPILFLGEVPTYCFPEEHPQLSIFPSLVAHFECDFELWDALTIQNFMVSLGHIYSFSNIPLCCALVVLFSYMPTWCQCYSMFLLRSKAAGVRACSRAGKKCPGQAKQKEVWENKIGLSQDP